MLKKHLTEILHDIWALDMLDQIAKKQRRLNEIREIRDRTWGPPSRSSIDLSIEGLNVATERRELIELLQERYHIVKALPHPFKLDNAWIMFTINSDKEALLKHLKQVERSMAKQK